MSQYVITTDVNGVITVQSGLIDTTQTSLNLIGRGAAGYGAAIAENTVRHLSNFASSSEPANPLNGQVWYDSNIQGLKLYVSQAVGWSEIPSANALSSSFVSKKELFGDQSISTTPLLVSRGGTGLTSVGAAGQVLISSGTGYTWADATTSFLSNVLRKDISTAPNVDNAISLGTTAKRFVEVNAVLFKGVAVQAQYADVAERYKIDIAGEPGDLVELGGVYEIRKTISKYSSDVIGVISTQPAIKMNSDAGNDVTHPYVAMVGRVPMKVVGKVLKGQRLVSSNIPGVAMAVDLTADVTVFNVIGRALTSKDNDAIGMIEVILGVK